MSRVWETTLMGLGDLLDTDIVYIGRPGDSDPDRHTTFDVLANFVSTVVAASGLFLEITGGTVSGEIVAETQFRTPPTSLAATGTINLDCLLSSLREMGPLTGDVTFTTSNLAAGRSVLVRVTNGATLRNVAFPASWVFVGWKPASIPASKTALLSVTSYGTTDADCVAAWVVEQ